MVTARSPTSKIRPFIASVVANWKLYVWPCVGFIYLATHLSLKHGEPTTSVTGFRKGITMSSTVVKRPFTMPLEGEK